MTAVSTIFAMNMMRPKTRKPAVYCSFIRNFVHFTTEGELIANFSGEWDGGMGGTMTSDLGENYSALGENVWTELFIGFSFAEVCPGLAGAKNTNSKTEGWYYYAKYEWWPASSTLPNPTVPAPGTARPTVSYENFWTYRDWPKYGLIMNGAKWVCIGTADTIFACGEIIGSVGTPGTPGTTPGTPSGTAPRWDACIHASCWNGNNAEQRMMNMLSPHMSTSTFNSYLTWMKNRGCDTAHVFVCNKGDGEYAGYSIYGNKFDFNIDSGYCNTMLSRINTLRANNLAVVIWLTADDSTNWNTTMAASSTAAQTYIDQLKTAGFLNSDIISTVVIGLEMTEYWNSTQVSRMASALRSKWSGMIGTHCNSGSTAFQTYGDIVFYQVNPGTATSTIIAQCNNIKNSTGKPVNMFEMERNPDRSKCEAVLNSGAAFGVGNW